ncbi:DUF1146 family protein [Oceanobacillus sp. CAU 1775]
MASIGQIALVGMFSHLIFIYLTWRLMQKLNIDPIIRKGAASEGRMLLLFIAIVIGTGVSNFVLDILQWTRDLPYMF